MRIMRLVLGVYAAPLPTIVNDMSGMSTRNL